MPIYLPTHFEQTDPAAIAGLIDAFPLATIVTSTSDGIVANHIPLQFDPVAGQSGVLRGHVARNNPIWQTTNSAVESLVIFQAPDTYITPNWYASKQAEHKVVPTWNYAVVHAYGRIQFHDDEKWLRGVIGKLTKSMESDQPKPWSMAQAPRDFLATQLGEIVGLEIEVTRLSAKWKVSQNRTSEDRSGVITGLDEVGDSKSSWMAEEVRKTTR